MAPAGQFAIDILFDEILLEIFACYVEETQYSQGQYGWHTLACVCRRWRSVAFGSPHRLNLRIFCSDTGRIPVSLRKKLDFWPPFPIVLTVNGYREMGEDNILATLEHHDCVCDIDIWGISRSLWEKALPLMQKPFPILTDLNLSYADRMTGSPVIPDSFLGGSAPQLRKLKLVYVPFPGLPKPLLSATDLVHLELYKIPGSEYISADAIATCLSTFTRLELLELQFESPRPRPKLHRRRTSSSTRALLPSLTRFTFYGVSEYLEDIVDKIDAPLLDRLRIMFFHQPIIDTPRLVQFINRVPKLRTCNEVRMELCDYIASVKVSSLSNTTINASLLLQDLYERRTDFQLSPLVRLCTSSFPQALIPTVEGLIISESYFSPGQDCIAPSLWWELLQPFTAVKDLFLFPEIAPCIAVILQELVGECVLELFPVLQNIFMKELQPSGLVPEGIKQFIAARQLACHPISVSHWEINGELIW
jgi:hypothetical protein